MSIPKDGYYIADVQLDSGGLCPMYVHVNLGKPHDEWGGELLPEACSNFREVDATPMVRVWPQNAAMELDALRTANAGLVEKVSPEPAFAFADPAAQQVAYDSLLFAQRRPLHRLVAGWLEEAHGDDLAPCYGLLAHHWQQADEPLESGNWPLVSASAIPYGQNSQVPREMNRADMDRISADFVAATRRAAGV